jgi:acetyl esterase/lipase
MMKTFNPAKYGTIEKEIVYGTADERAQRMDVYYPASGGPWPGLVFVHGGGWSEGDKAPVPVIPTEAGLLVVSINYRMYPAYKFPAMIEDVKCAIRYLRAHASTYNLDPGRIALVGHSAGGHLVALAGLAGKDAGWDGGPYAGQSSAVQAVVPMSGPTDLARKFPAEVQELIANVFGEEQLGRASPVNYARAEAPPFLIVHGEADEIVPVEQAHQLYDALKKAEAPVEKLILQNGGHGVEPVGGTVKPSVEEMFARMLQFLGSSLNMKA